MSVSMAEKSTLDVYGNISRKPSEQSLPTTSVQPTDNAVLEQMQMDEAPSPVRSKTRLVAILAALYTSRFVAALDQTIVATAIPTITEALRSGSGYSWIGGAFLLATAASAPVVAKLSDIWGRKPIILASVALFFFGSLICALSTSMAMLIAGRTIQGIAGGGLSQLPPIIISDLFSVKSRTVYFGLMEIMWAIAAGIGPILGGAFAQGPGWRWCFWINLPIASCAFALLFFFLDVHNPRTKMSDGLKAVDWPGMVAILGLVLMLLLGLEFGGGTFPWDSPTVICLIIFGALFSLVFIYAERRLAKYPLIPLELFGNRSNVAALVVTFVHSFVFIAPEYWLPLYFQSVKEASPLRSGVLIIPLIAIASFSGMFAALLLSRTRISYRELIWVGTTTVTLGTGLFIILKPSSTIAVIVGLQILVGVGSGLLFQPPLIAIQANTAQDDVATATATLGFVRQVAAAVSIVLGGVVFQNGMKERKTELMAAGASPDLVGQFSGVEAVANTKLVGGIQDEVVKAAVKEAYAWSLRNMWIMYTCVVALGIIAGAFISKKALSSEHTETRTGLKDRTEHIVQI